MNAGRVLWWIGSAAVAISAGSWGFAVAVLVLWWIGDFALQVFE